MRKLVFVTQQVDPAHHALAATVPMIRALAAHVDELVVLADGAAEDSLPPNARVRLFRDRHKVGRGLRFEAALVRELSPRPVGVVAHMCPIYAVLGAPLVRPLGIPLVLWFTHWRASATLRAAAALSSAVASVDRRSFPLDSSKVHAIGHGIDLTEFPCRERPAGEGGLRLLALGRYSPAKGLDVVLRALRRSLDGGLDVWLTVHGPTLSELEQKHHRHLMALRDELGLGDKAELAAAVDRSQVPALLAANDLLVNNMRAGAPDKVVYEAAASCVPVLASNPVFDTLLPDELRFPRDDPAELAARVADFAERTPEDRAALGRSLRVTVALDHSVESWAKGILQLTR